MITKIGAATVSSVKPVSSIKPVQIKAVDPAEKKPIMPTTQTQDVANNLRGVHEDGYDSREGFGRPDTAKVSSTQKTAFEKDAFLSGLGSMAVKAGKALFGGTTGTISMLGKGMQHAARGFSTGRHSAIMGSNAANVGTFTGVGRGLNFGFKRMNTGMNSVWNKMSGGEKAVSTGIAATGFGALGLGGGEDNSYEPQQRFQQYDYE